MNEPAHHDTVKVSNDPVCAVVTAMPVHAPVKPAKPRTLPPAKPQPAPPVPEPLWHVILLDDDEEMMAGSDDRNIEADKPIAQPKQP